MTAAIASDCAAPEVNAARICAVFDLDETLIRSKSMLAVLEQYHRSTAASPDQAERRIRDVRANLTWYVERNANRAAGDADDNGFDQELQAHIGLPCAHRHADADFASAFSYGN